MSRGRFVFVTPFVDLGGDPPTLETALASVCGTAPQLARDTEGFWLFWDERNPWDQVEVALRHRIYHRHEMVNVETGRMEVPHAAP